METTTHKINRLINYYSKLAGSRNPITIAKYANIGIHICPLDICGYYGLYKRKRWIFISDSIPQDGPLFLVVAAHELGHALLHKKESCAFIKNHTLLLTNGIEVEANQFAAQLLITDDILEEYHGCTKDTFCRCTGYPAELIEIRMNHFT